MHVLFPELIRHIRYKKVACWIRKKLKLYTFFWTIINVATVLLFILIEEQMVRYLHIYPAQAQRPEVDICRSLHLKKSLLYFRYA